MTTLFAVLNILDRTVNCINMQRLPASRVHGEEDRGQPPFWACFSKRLHSRKVQPAGKLAPGCTACHTGPGIEA
jgi:hypothetical protein